MKVRALRQHPYAGVIHAKGSEYEIISAKDVNILCAVKAIEVVAVTPKRAAGKPENLKEGKSRYSRKDMRAEEAKPEVKLEAKPEVKLEATRNDKDESQTQE